MDVNKLAPHLLATYRNMRAQQSRESGTSGGAAEAGEGRGASGAPADGVSLSAGVRELRRLQGHVQSAPDVREERVAEVRAQLASGTYYVPDDALAESILSAVG